MSLFSIIFFYFYILTAIICGEESKIKSLCEDPIIHSADRLVNNTVRVYRGQYYWELIGLPAKTVKVEGPFKIWNLNMGTLSINTAIVTLLEGPNQGSTYKIQEQRYWAWDKEGKQFAGALNGLYWDLIPLGGLEAAIHNGDKTDPMIIGFKGIYVYYFSTKDMIWTGDKNGYIGGKYNENFPPDLTAAFSWPADDPNDRYIAYLFQWKKHCKRTKILKSGLNCNEWIDNRVLFGCAVKFDTETNSEKPVNTSDPISESPSSPSSVSTTASTDKVPEKPAITGHSLPVTSISVALITLLLCLTSILIF